MRLAPALLLVLVATPSPAAPTAAPATAAQTPARSDSVHLRYGWKPGLKLSATSTKTRTRVTDSRESRTVTSRYILRTTAQGDSLRVRLTDLAMDAKSDSSGLGQELVAGFAEVIPDYVVAPDGAFAGLHGVSAFRERLLGLLGEAADAGLREQLRSMLTDDLFSAQAQQHWNALVATWAGATLELGAEYSMSGREPFAILPGESVLMNYSISAARSDSRARGGRKRACVELRMKSTADSADVRRALQAMLSKFSGGQAPPNWFTTLVVESQVSVVTEPDGMLPHSYSLTKSVRGTVTVEGREHPVEQLDVTETRYTYP